MCGKLKKGTNTWRGTDREINIIRKKEHQWETRQKKEARHVFW